MKQIFILFALIGVFLFSCDGRYHKHDTNAEVLKNNQLYSSFSKKLEFLPEKNVEIQTDTILSNGFELHLKYTSLDTRYQKVILNTDPKRELNFKEFGSDVICKLKGKVILNKRIDKTMFSNFKISETWNLAIMQYVWIDYENSLKDKVRLNTSFYFPETETYRDFTIEIDKNGTISINPKSFDSKLT